MTPKATPEYRLGYLTGMVRGDGHLKSYSSESNGRVRTVDHFRLTLADHEALDRTRTFLDELGIATFTLPFSAVTPTRRPLTAIGTSTLSDIAAIQRFITWPEAPTEDWQRGFLAGIFDAEGSYSQGILRISNTDPEIVEQMLAGFRRFGFDVVVEDIGRANGLRVVRLRGGMPAVVRFVHLVDPAIRRKCSIEGRRMKTSGRQRLVAVEDLGLSLPMYDITTGTGDFVAHGVISHNCYARGSHSWLELDTGTGFDREVVVKVNVVDVLAREMARPSWRHEHVALGTNTDPYQRAEGRYRLMPGIVSALARSGTPLSVLTKGTLLRRDLPLLQAAARDVPVGLGVSMAIWDDALHRSLEPGTPTPRARLGLVRAATDAGLRCGVMLAPVLPWLTDTDEHLDAALAAIAASGATGVTVLPLHLRPGAKEWFTAWLTREHPGLVEPYAALYARGANAPRSYRDALQARVAPLLERHGLGGPYTGAGVRRGAREGQFPAGSLPIREVVPADPTTSEQLSLL